jgi:hypothetical protein
MRMQGWAANQAVSAPDVHLPRRSTTCNSVGVNAWNNVADDMADDDLVGDPRTDTQRGLPACEPCPIEISCSPDPSPYADGPCARGLFPTLQVAHES